MDRTCGLGRILKLAQQNNKPKYISFVRGKEPFMCPVRAIGLLLFEKRDEAFFTVEDPTRAANYDTVLSPPS
ncbi:hypothetical protein HaLaN_20062, partial [Haematococcus lacustris]